MNRMKNARADVSMHASDLFKVSYRHDKPCDRISQGRYYLHELERHVMGYPHRFREVLSCCACFPCREGCLTLAPSRIPNPTFIYESGFADGHESCIFRCSSES